MPTILYEDERVVAVDKPAGLATIPERFERHCLLAEVEAYLGGKAFVVHRLDKDVSGVVVFARDAGAHRHLNTLFETRAVEKTYAAVVHGVVAAGEGEVDRPIRPFGSGRMGVDPAKGKPSRTRFVVRRRLAAYSVLDVYPVTGRRHQIRVHLYSIGHPLVGDPLYGDRAQQQGYPRLFLHARRLAFAGPDGRAVAVASPLPEAFDAFVRG